MSFMNSVLLIWWLLSNGFIQYMELDFLSIVTDKIKIRDFILWIALSELLVILNVRFQLSGIYLIHILLLAAFAVFILKIKWHTVVAPIVIIFTLYTFMEGYSAICMYWVSVSTTSAVHGMVVQILISFILIILFLCMLKLIQKKYYVAMQQSVSSYLYILLLPCGFIVFIVRTGLKLDSRTLEKYVSALGISASLAAFIIMSAAVVIFVMMIKIFSIIICLTEEKTDTAILKAQLDGQKIYIEEAEKRNKAYSRFQHDIENHLLVLSGLIHKGEYNKAEQYISRLQIQCESLFSSISTGSAVLDIILKEKLSYAVRGGVEVSCNVKIPEEFTFDDIDLCIIFSNILDNAVHACMKSSCEKKISICTKKHAHFLLIEAVNTMPEDQIVKEGVGLSNIRNVTKKYWGTVELFNDDGRFRISILLCPPLPLTS